jgi:phosphohistidine swiveling domain-containing protein
VITEITKQKFYKAVEQLTLDGTLITVHKSLTVAAQVVGLSKGTMSGVVRQQKTYGGFSWRYSEDA